MIERCKYRKANWNICALKMSWLTLLSMYNTICSRILQLVLYEYLSYISWYSLGEMGHKLHGVVRWMVNFDPLQNSSLYIQCSRVSDVWCVYVIKLWKFLSRAGPTSRIPPYYYITDSRNNLQFIALHVNVHLYYVLTWSGDIGSVTVSTRFASLCVMVLPLVNGKWSTKYQK